MGERIKELRKFLGLSQIKFAEMIGVTHTAVLYIEQNKSKGSKPLFLTICNKFNVSEQWLFEGTGEMFTSSNGETQALEMLNSQIVLSETDIKIIKEFKKLTPEQQKIFSRFLKDIVKTINSSEV